MIRRGFLWGVVTLGVAAFAVAAFDTAAMAQAGADAKLNSTSYNVKLVQAMDECSAPVTTLNGSPACDPANANTDPTHFNVGKILVKMTPNGSKVLAILKSSGVAGDCNSDPTHCKKDLAGKNLQTHLVLRVTRFAGTPQVTWADRDLLCPIIAVGTNGNSVSKTNLTDCGLSNAVLSNFKNNTEIVSASIIDADTGLAIAVPGVRHK